MLVIANEPKAKCGNLYNDKETEKDLIKGKKDGKTNSMVPGAYDQGDARNGGETLSLRRRDLRFGCACARGDLK